MFMFAKAEAKRHQRKEEGEGQLPKLAVLFFVTQLANSPSLIGLSSRSKLATASNLNN